MNNSEKDFIATSVSVEQRMVKLTLLDGSTHAFPASYYPLLAGASDSERTTDSCAGQRMGKASETRCWFGSTPCVSSLLLSSTHLQPVETLDAIQCDCCRRRFEAGDIFEIQEFLHIDFSAGYGSIFGDENHVQADICQQCLKDRLGDCLRITDPANIRKTPNIAG